MTLLADRPDIRVLRHTVRNIRGQEPWVLIDYLDHRGEQEARLSGLHAVELIEQLDRCKCLDERDQMMHGAVLKCLRRK